MKDMCSGYRVRALLVDDEQEFEEIFREALEKVTGQLSFPIRLSTVRIWRELWRGKRRSIFIL